MYTLETLVLLKSLCYYLNLNLNLEMLCLHVVLAVYTVRGHIIETKSCQSKQHNYSIISPSPLYVQSRVEKQGMYFSRKYGTNL